MDTAQRYRAVASRDARFDGQFVLAVRTTGIYCRPSCPARTPLPANVEYFDAAAAAHEAGYRACKRCLPDAVPGSPRWNVRSDVAGRAMRLVADGVVEREGVPGLAARLGYSTRHLTRLLTTELGAGPLALARAHRAQTARTLLVATDLPMADVAFAAGFASVRQFNDTVAEVYALNPTQVRARRRAADGRAGADGARGPQDPAATPDAAPGVDGAAVVPATLELALPVRAPFDAAGLLRWLAVRAVPGVEVAGPGAYARAIALPGGPASFHLRTDGTRVLLRARLTALADVPVLVARVRRLLDLDADPVAVDDALAAEPAVAPLVRAVPGIRLPGAVDAHEMLLRAIVGQQISVAAARTQLSLLAAAAGSALDGPGVVEGVTHLFPTPAQVVARGAGVLVGPRARTETILRVAAMLADGSLDVCVGDEPAAQRERLVAVRGIGPWAADYLAMRVLGAPDVLPTGDVALRTGARLVGLPDAPRALAAWGETVAPWRSYASLHLWRAASTSRIPTTTAAAAATDDLGGPPCTSPR